MDVIRSVRFRMAAIAQRMALGLTDESPSSEGAPAEAEEKAGSMSEASAGEVSVAATKALRKGKEHARGGTKKKTSGKRKKLKSFGWFDKEYKENEALVPCEGPAPSLDTALAELAPNQLTPYNETQRAVSQASLPSIPEEVATTASAGAGTAVTTANGKAARAERKSKSGTGASGKQKSKKRPPLPSLDWNSAFNDEYDNKEALVPCEEILPKSDQPDFAATSSARYSVEATSASSVSGTAFESANGQRAERQATSSSESLASSSSAPKPAAAGEVSGVNGSAKPISAVTQQSTASGPSSSITPKHPVSGAMLPSKEAQASQGTLTAKPPLPPTRLRTPSAKRPAPPARPPKAPASPGAKKKTPVKSVPAVTGQERTVTESPSKIPVPPGQRTTTARASPAAMTAKTGVRPIATSPAPKTPTRIPKATSPSPTRTLSKPKGAA